MYDFKDCKIKETPLILGIESSCDETAAAVIFGRKLLSNCIISSAAEQSKFGGVVPEIASRAHAEAVDEVVARALSEAGVTPKNLDAVAVTYGAGLLGALLVGLSFAKSFAYSLNIPLIGVSHIRGHLAAAYLTDTTLKPPYVSLLVSGGHTAVILVKDYTDFKVEAETLDDAAGEAFDKVARVLHLPYPGGPNVERAAKNGKNIIPLPPCLVRENRERFSYSGLKTAVVNYCHMLEMRGEPVPIFDVALSFQKAAIDPLVKKTAEVARRHGVKTITVGGGVAANGYLRDELKRACEKDDFKLILPEKKFCTDNAAMIAAEGLIKYGAGEFSPLSLNASARVDLR